MELMKNKTKFFCSLLFITVIIIQNGGLALAEKTPQTLRKADISSLIKEPQFDSREYGIITPVKDQGTTSLCWAYSTVNASEASILRSGIDKNASVRSLSLLPEQIGYARWNRGADPLQNAQNRLNSCCRFTFIAMVRTCEIRHGACRKRMGKFRLQAGNRRFYKQQNDGCKHSGT